MSENYDIAIIGGGLAGLSAAVTAGRLGHRVVLLSNGLPGGELIKVEAIDGVPGFEDPIAGFDLCPITQEQADAFGVVINMEPASSVGPDGELWTIGTAGEPVSAKALIIATGTRMKKLGVPGEVEFEGRGVSECASCDAPLLRGKVAVVAGGGDSAMQEALVLAQHLQSVIMITTAESLSGQAAYRDAIEAEPKITIQTGTKISEIKGDTGVSAVLVEGPDGTTEIATDAVFVFIGLEPETELFADLVAFNSEGQVEVDAALRSSRPGIAAAGNVRAGSPHRAAGAMGDGASAAMAVDAFLIAGTWG